MRMDGWIVSSSCVGGIIQYCSYACIPTRLGGLITPVHSGGRHNRRQKTVDGDLLSSPHRRTRRRVQTGYR